ncbi:MAG: hypothetical protein ACJ8G3_15105 [Burkholderiaceae bacterium]
MNLPGMRVLSADSAALTCFHGCGNFAVGVFAGLVLTKRIDRPKAARKPTNEGDLKDQANDSGKRSAEKKNVSQGRKREIKKRPMFYKPLGSRGADASNIALFYYAS